VSVAYQEGPGKVITYPWVAFWMITFAAMACTSNDSDSAVCRLLPGAGPLTEAGSCAQRPARSSSSTSPREPPRLSPGPWGDLARRSHIARRTDPAPNARGREFRAAHPAAASSDGFRACATQPS
jgi:hypothetical protein